MLDRIVHTLVVVREDDVPLLEVPHMCKPLSNPKVLEAIEFDDKVFSKIGYLTTQFSPQCALRCAPCKLDLSAVHA